MMMNEGLEIEVSKREVSLDEIMSHVRQKFPSVHFGKLQINITEDLVMIEERSTVMIGAGRFVKADSWEDKRENIKEVLISASNFTMEGLVNAIGVNFSDVVSWKDIIVSVGKWVDDKPKGKKTGVLALRNWTLVS
ncbi:MAG: hypothetical protein PHN74_01040 [Candidatus Pacebacteria bacterium]|nr:hypothetical protein [Candidatus Paceibacterota bacterium]